MASVECKTGSRRLECADAHPSVSVAGVGAGAGSDASLHGSTHDDVSWSPWREACFGAPASDTETKLGITFTVASKPETTVTTAGSSMTIKQDLDAGLGAVVWDCVRRCFATWFYVRVWTLEHVSDTCGLLMAMMQGRVLAHVITDLRARTPKLPQCAADLATALGGRVLDLGSGTGNSAAVLWCSYSFVPGGYVTLRCVCVRRGGGFGGGCRGRCTCRADRSR